MPQESSYERNVANLKKVLESSLSHDFDTFSGIKNSTLKSSYRTWKVPPTFPSHTAVQRWTKENVDTISMLFERTYTWNFSDLKKCQNYGIFSEL